MLSEDILKPKENETPTGKKKRNRKPPVNPATINQFAVKVRIKPTPEQIVMFEKTFGCCRKIWNLMLADKKNAYDEGRKIPFPEPVYYKKMPEFAYLNEIDSLALSNVQLNLKAAYKRAFESGFGFPRFKSKRDLVQSYTTNNQVYSGTDHFTKEKCWNSSIEILDGRVLKLPRVGLVDMVMHRNVQPFWELRSVTISRGGDGKYYASILFRTKKEEIPELIIDDKTKALGLDYKSDGLYMDSEGNCAKMPKFYQNAHKRLAIAQRELSRKTGSKKGEKKSKNYLKQLAKVNRIHAHIANQRKDFLHKKSAAIANQYDVVCVEDLDMKAMSNKGFGNGKATLNNGYGIFQSMLKHKLESQGKKFVVIDKWFASSQLCSHCGHKQKMPLNVRTYKCPECGSSIDRDINAAINILEEGLRMLKERPLVA